MHEVDFLPVEHGEHSGDAIALRFAYPNPLNDDWVVCVIDGGYTDEGHALVEHIQRYYATSRVDLVVSTHPDADHATGLKVVCSELEVGELMMHRPWSRSATVAAAFTSGRVTDLGMREKLRNALNASSELENEAVRRGIPISDPFAGESRFAGTFTVLGPSTAYYDSLLPQFRDQTSLTKAVASAVAEALAKVKSVGEAIDIETLDDSGTTRAENNSSTILLFQPNDARMLFTGDAGIPALESAMDFADPSGLGSPYTFVQVPHHGSRRNVGPTILSRILGDYPRDPYATAFVSASKDSPKHPSRQVTNAFYRRGVPVVSTEGKAICHRSPDAPKRDGWTSVEPLPLYSTVEVEE